MSQEILGNSSQADFPNVGLRVKCRLFENFIIATSIVLAPERSVGLRNLGDGRLYDIGYNPMVVFERPVVVSRSYTAKC